MSKLQEYMNQIGVHPTKNNHREDQQIYTMDGRKWVFAYLRNLESDFYFTYKDEMYVLEQNQDYLDKSKTLMGRFDDSRKIPFENCKKIGIFDSFDNKQEEGSLSNNQEEFYIKLTESGNIQYAKTINGKVYCIITKDVGLKITNEGLDPSILIGFAKTNKLEFETAFNEAIKRVK